MSETTKRVILHSINGYDEKYDALLQNLIADKILLFCAVGKDCKLWHDIMDEIFVGYGEERDFDLITTWHPDKNLQEIIEFAECFDEYGGEIKIIEI